MNNHRFFHQSWEDRGDCFFRLSTDPSIALMLSLAAASG